MTTTTTAPKTLVNFSHPLTPSAQQQIEAAVGGPIVVVEVKVQVNQAAPMVPQVRRLLNQAYDLVEKETGLSNVDLVNLPGLAAVASLIYPVIGEHQDLFLLPDLVRLAPKAGVVPPVFELVEIISGDHLTAG